MLLSTEVAFEILNVGINGGVDAWATVTEKLRRENSPMCSAARFSSRSKSELSAVLGVAEVVQGIQLVVEDGFPIQPHVRAKVLRVLANNSLAEIDLEVADCILRAVFAELVFDDRLLAAWRRLSECGRRGLPMHEFAESA